MEHNSNTLFIMPPKSLETSEKAAVDCLLLLGQESGSTTAAAPPSLGGPSSGFHPTKEAHSRAPSRFAHPEPRYGSRSAGPPHSRLSRYGHHLRPMPHHPGPYPVPPMSQIVVSTPSFPPTHHHHHHHQAPPHYHPNRGQSFPLQSHYSKEMMERSRANAVSPVSGLTTKPPHVSPDMSPRTILPPAKGSNPTGTPPLLPTTGSLPRSAQQKDKQTSNQHESPSPRLLPENSGVNDNEDEITPNTYDVLIGIGRTCSSHPGNRRFHKEIYESCQDYFDADYKKGVVDLAIRRVHRRGGRFLAKKADKWVVVTDHDRLERNTRKSFHQARKQRQAQSERFREEKEASTQATLQPIANRDARQPAHHQHQGPPHSNPQQQRLREGLHVAVYRRSVGAYCIGIIEAESKGLHYIRFEDPRFGSDWIDLEQVDCRVFSP